MKTKTLITLFVAVLIAASGLFAQTTTTSTTLAAAVTTTTQARINLTAATTVAVGGYIYTEDGEVMQVQSTYVAASTSVPVTRGVSGTRAITHANATVVWVFAPGIQARVGLRSGPLPGSNPMGSCTATAEPLLPIFNTTTNSRYDCIGSQWVKSGVRGSALWCGATTGATATCTPSTAIASRVIAGIATLASNAQVVTFSPAFTASTTYACVANDVTTRANVVQAVPTTATTMTITNTTGATDAVHWICVGY